MAVFIALMFLSAAASRIAQKGRTSNNGSVQPSPIADVQPSLQQGASDLSQPGAADGAFAVSSQAQGSQSSSQPSKKSQSSQSAKNDFGFKDSFFAGDLFGSQTSGDVFSRLSEKFNQQKEKLNNMFGQAKTSTFGNSASSKSNMTKKPVKKGQKASGSGSAAQQSVGQDSEASADDLFVGDRLGSPPALNPDQQAPLSSDQSAAPSFQFPQTNGAAPQSPAPFGASETPQNFDGFDFAFPIGESSVDAQTMNMPSSENGGSKAPLAAPYSTDLSKKDSTLSLSDPFDQKKINLNSSEQNGQATQPSGQSLTSQQKSPDASKLPNTQTTKTLIKDSPSQPAKTTKPEVTAQTDKNTTGSLLSSSPAKVPSADSGSKPMESTPANKNLLAQLLHGSLPNIFQASVPSNAQSPQTGYVPNSQQPVDPNMSPFDFSSFYQNWGNPSDKPQNAPNVPFGDDFAPQSSVQTTGTTPKDSAVTPPLNFGDFSQSQSTSSHQDQKNNLSLYQDNFPFDFLNSQGQSGSFNAPQMNQPQPGQSGDSSYSASYTNFGLPSWQPDNKMDSLPNLTVPNMLTSPSSSKPLFPSAKFPSDSKETNTSGVSQQENVPVFPSSKSDIPSTKNNDKKFEFPSVKKEFAIEPDLISTPQITPPYQPDLINRPQISPPYLPDQMNGPQISLPYQTDQINKSQITPPAQIDFQYLNQFGQPSNSQSNLGQPALSEDPFEAFIRSQQSAVPVQNSFDFLIQQFSPSSQNNAPFAGSANPNQQQNNQPAFPQSQGQQPQQNQFGTPQNSQPNSFELDQFGFPQNQYSMPPDAFNPNGFPPGMNQQPNNPFGSLLDLTPQYSQPPSQQPQQSKPQQNGQFPSQSVKNDPMTDPFAQYPVLKPGNSRIQPILNITKKEEVIEPGTIRISGPKINFGAQSITVPDPIFKSGNVPSFPDKTEVNVKGLDFDMPTMTLSMAKPDISINPAKVEISSTPTEINQSDIVVPGAKVTIGRTKINVPKPDIKIEQQNVDIKGKDVRVPQSRVNIGETKINVDRPKVNRLDQDFSVEVDDISLPSQDISIPVPEVNMDDPEIFLPDAQINVPGMQFNIKPSNVVSRPSVINVAAPKVTGPGNVNVAMPRIQLNSGSIKVPTPIVNVGKPQVNFATQEINLDSEEINVPQTQINIPRPQISIGDAKFITEGDVNVQPGVVNIPSPQIDLPSPNVRYQPPQINYEQIDAKISPSKVYIQSPKIAMSNPQIQTPKPMNIKLDDVILPQSTVNIGSSNIRIPQPNINIDQTPIVINQQDLSLPQRTINVRGSSVNVGAPVINRAQAFVSPFESQINIPQQNINVGSSTFYVPAPQVNVQQAKINADSSPINVPQANIFFKGPSINVPAVKVRQDTSPINIPAKQINVPAQKINFGSPEVRVDAPNVSYSDPIVNVDNNFQGLNPGLFNIQSPSISVQGPSIYEQSLVNTNPIDDNTQVGAALRRIKNSIAIPAAKAQNSNGFDNLNISNKIGGLWNSLSSQTINFPQTAQSFSQYGNFALDRLPLRRVTN